MPRGTGSQEGYVKSLIHYLQHDSTETVRCVVFNARGCAQSELRTAQLYSAAYTDDFRNALRYIQRRLPGAPLVAVGYSLGSNILVKYLGEEGERTPLVGAASVGNPFDLLYCMRRLQHRWFYRLVYANKLGFNLKRAFCRCVPAHDGVLRDGAMAGPHCMPQRHALGGARPPGTATSLMPRASTRSTSSTCCRCVESREQGRREKYVAPERLTWRHPQLASCRPAPVAKRTGL